MNVNPKKFLGQHFLIDKNIANKIVSLLSEAPTIIEIGPGKGILSEMIYQKFPHSSYFVDIDKESINYLINELQLPYQHVLHHNFLSIDFSNFSHPIHLIGNLPYNISSQIFFKVLENHTIINEMVCMVQKEVAERIIAKPNTKTYGILSILLQTFYSINYEFTVSEHVFFPKPKVKSAVIKLTSKHFVPNFNEQLFFSIVKCTFNKRRKILSNSLINLIPKEAIPEKYKNYRPEQLTIEDFIELTKLIEQI